MAKKLYFNGNVITVNEKEEVVQAVAIEDGKIIKVGTNEEILALKDNDAVDSTKVLDSSYLLVHDSDFLGIVNELKNGGAEAISINGERIVSTSSITCEGNVISINGEKVSSPFVIKAIGRPTMYSALSRPGGTIEYLNSRIIATISQESNITIDKYSGVISARYMQYDE